MVGRKLMALALVLVTMPVYTACSSSEKSAQKAEQQTTLGDTVTYSAPRHLYALLERMPDSATLGVAAAPPRDLQRLLLTAAAQLGMENQARSLMHQVSMSLGGNEDFSATLQDLGIDSTKPAGFFLDLRPLGERVAEASMALQNNIWENRAPLNSPAEYWISLTDIVVIAGCHDCGIVDAALRSVLSPTEAPRQKSLEGAQIQVTSQAAWSIVDGNIVISDSVSLLQQVLCAVEPAIDLEDVDLPTDKENVALALATRFDRLNESVPDINSYFEALLGHDPRHLGLARALVRETGQTVWTPSPCVTTLYLGDERWSIEAALSLDKQPSYRETLTNTAPSSLGQRLPTTSPSGILFRPQQAHLQLLSELAAVGEQYATSDISAQRNLASEIATLSHTIGAGILTNDQNEPFFFAAVEAPEPSNVIGALRHQFDVAPLEGTDNSHTIKIPSGSPVGHLRIIDKVIFLTTNARNLDFLAASWSAPPKDSRNTPVDAVLQHGWITPETLSESVEQLLTEPPQGMVEIVSQLSKHLDHLSIGQTISSGQQRVYLRLHPYSQQDEGQLSDLPAPAGVSGQE